MDIDFGWESDENIILGVELPRSSTSISVQMKDLRFSTVSRVIFQLSEQLPCISAVGVSLLSEPRIDFSMKPEGSLTAIPGISDMIDRIWKVVESFTAIPGVSDMINQSMRAVESFKAVPGISDMIDRTMNVVDGSLTAIPGISNVVNTIVTHMLQWPKRVVVLVGSVPVDTSELELKPEGKLTVKVVEANDLDMTNKSRARPYVVAYIRPLFKFKTEVIKNNLHPVWNESFELLAEDKHTQELTVEVFDQGIILAKRLGTAKFSLSELEPGKQTEATCTFKGKDNKNVGSCTVKLLYHQFSKEEQLVAFEEEKRELKEAGVKRSMKVAFNRAFPSVGYRVGRVRKVGIGLSNAGKFIGKTMTQGIPTKVEPQVLTE